MNEATNSVSSKGKIDYIKVNITLISDKQEMANCFNDFFAKIGPKTAEKVHYIDKDFQEYLPPPPVHSFLHNIFTTVNDMNQISLWISTIFR